LFVIVCKELLNKNTQSLLQFEKIDQWSTNRKEKEMLKFVGIYRLVSRTQNEYHWENIKVLPENNWGITIRKKRVINIPV
jgi:hypothetical protein